MYTKGRNYEHTLGDLVADATDETLIPLATGYNSTYSRSVDLIIDDGEAVHVFELKRTSKDAYTLHWDEDDVQRDDLYGLLRFAVEYPRPTYPYAGVRFDNRQLTISKLYVNDYPNRDEVLDKAVMLSPTQTKHTSSHNLRFYKPDTDGWPTTNLDQHDAQAVLDAIGYQF